MNDIEIRDRILQTLYQAYRKHPGVGRRIMDEFADEFGIDKELIEFNIQYLVDHDFVKYVAMGGLVGITPKGINFAEGPSKYNPTEDYKSQSIEVSGGTIGQIFQVGHDFNTSLFLDRLTAQIESHPEISPEKKSHWKDFLKDIPRTILDELIRIAVHQTGI
jgi:hypothetical protein